MVEYAKLTTTGSEKAANSIFFRTRHILVIESPGENHCFNCGSPVRDAFCSSCGQKNQALRQPVTKFVTEAFSEYFGIDGRFWVTTKALLTRPGKLTKEYIAGRRNSYLRPLRIYLIATVFFFFLLSVLDPVADLEKAVGSQLVPDTTATVASRLSTIDTRISDDEAAVNLLIRETDSLQQRFNSVNIAFEADSSNGVIPDSLLDGREDEVEDALDDLEDSREDLERLQKRNALRKKRFLWQQDMLRELPPDSVIRPADFHQAAERVFPDANGGNIDINMPDWLPESSSIRRLKEARTDSERASAFADLGRGMIEKLPIAIFLMLPIFAFLLKIIYIRRDWYYTEHLVFGLHTHAFAFTVFTAIAIISEIFGDTKEVDIVTMVMLAIVMGYFFLAMKNVYGQGYIKTFLKAILLGSMYNMVLIAGLIVALILAAAIG